MPFLDKKESLDVSVRQKQKRTTPPPATPRRAVAKGTLWIHCCGGQLISTVRCYRVEAFCPNMKIRIHAEAASFSLASSPLHSFAWTLLRPFEPL